MNYKYITETFFQWTINTGNYSTLSNQNGANLRPKRTKLRLAAWLRLGPLGDPDPLAAIVHVLYCTLCLWDHIDLSGLYTKTVST